MFAELDLDEEEFESMVEEARNKIMGIYPGWTDFNYHDPGITLIELFAWLKESQQYYLNQTGDEMKDKFRKLLGMKRRRREEAHSFLQLDSGKNRMLFRGAKVYAGSICFETAVKKQLIGRDICALFSVRGYEACGEAGSLLDFMDRGRLEFDHRIRFFPFGEEPKEGDGCFFAFDFPLPPQQRLSLYLDIWEEYQVKRNPITAGLFAPMAELSVQYYSRSGWEEARWQEDHTCGFLTDGFLFFVLDTKMKETRVMERQGYYLRIVLKRQEYDMPPCITRASINIVEIRQRDTLSEAIDLLVKREEGECRVMLDSFLAAEGKTRIFYEKEGEYLELSRFEKQIWRGTAGVEIKIPEAELADCDTGRLKIINRDPRLAEEEVWKSANGFPMQQMDLEEQDLEYDSFELMLRPQNKKGFQVWEKVEDFSLSLAGDCHYRLDGEKGFLQFGDGVRGRVPKGEILILSYARTKGSQGNVKEYRINRLYRAEDEGMRAWNIENAEGGTDWESGEECFRRTERALRKPDCAVTDGDYEAYAMQTPGLMLEACKVIRAPSGEGGKSQEAEHSILLAVKPYHEQKRLKISRTYEKNIRAYLEQFRLAGTGIRFLQPEYVPIEIAVQLVKKSRYQASEEEIKNMVRAFFKKQESVFGITLEYGKLYGMLDKLPCVSSVRTLSISTRSSTIKRLEGGDLVLPANGLMYLQEVEASFLSED